MDEPLLTTNPPQPANNPTQALASLSRISTILAVTLISLWANYEASKGFDITVLQAPGPSLAARHYNLMFVSNGRAARAILNASASIERALYPDEANSFPRKPINSVTLRVADCNLTRSVLVDSAAGGPGISDYVIHVSADVVEERELADEKVVAAVYLGMVRVWVRDGKGEAPGGVVDGVVRYVWGAAGFGGGEVVRGGVGGNGREEGTCEEEVGFVGYCEERRPGFVARLNREMEGRWEEGVWDKALGSSARVMCAGFRGRVEDWAGNLTGRRVDEYLELESG